MINFQLNLKVRYLKNDSENDFENDSKDDPEIMQELFGKMTWE